MRPCSQRPPYLGEGQTVLVLVLVLHLEIIQGFALGRGRRQGPEALHIAGGQEAMCTVQLPVEPVLVHPASQDDDVTLVELEVTRFFPFVTVEGFAVGKLGRILKAKHSIGYSAQLLLGGPEVRGAYVLRACAECPRIGSISKEQTPCHRDTRSQGPAQTRGSTRRPP